MSKFLTAIALSLSFLLLLLLPVGIEAHSAETLGTPVQLENPATILQTTPVVPPVVGPQINPEMAGEVEGQVHGLYFYSEDCAHCQLVYEEVIQPLQNEYGTLLDMRLLSIDEPDNYELLIEAE